LCRSVLNSVFFSQFVCQLLKSSRGRELPGKLCKRFHEKNPVLWFQGIEEKNDAVKL
jgi:hypothetical protein